MNVKAGTEDQSAAGPDTGETEVLALALDGMAALVAVLDSDGVVLALRGGFVRSGVVDAVAGTGKRLDSDPRWRSPSWGAIAFAIDKALAGRQGQFDARFGRREDDAVRLRVVVQPVPGAGPARVLVTAIQVGDGAQSGDGSVVAILAESDLRLRLALEAGEMGLWTWRVGDEVVVLDGVQRRLWGFDSDVMPLGAFFRRILEDDRARVREDIDRTVAEGEGATFISEFRVSDPSGAVRWLANRARLVGRGTETTLRGVTYDVSHRHEAEDRRLLLLAELSHRVRNMLAVVQGLASLSRRSAQTVDGYVGQFNARLLMLSHAFDLLVGSDWRGARLADLVPRALGSLLDDPGRISAQIDDVSVGPALAQSLALVFHELANNSMKHGALSAASGRVALSVRRADGAVLIVWREYGGPLVSPPRGTGFGTMMMERALRDQHGAKVELFWGADGLVYTARLPLAADAPRRSSGLASRPIEARHD